jgi:hypothetical protein
MEAIGLDHLTRALAGLHRAMTANDTMWVTGKGTAAVLNTITTGITIETATSTIMTGTVIMTTAGTTDSVQRSEQPRAEPTLHKPRSVAAPDWKAR